MSHNLTLKEFLARKRTEFEEHCSRFEEDWKSWSEQDPEHYPDKLPEGDWEEQFDIFGEAIRPQ